MNVCACVCAYAQTDTIRYVREDGAYNNDGRSWATAKNKVQDAINDLRDYLRANNLTSGSVYIAAGTYVPTESTEASGGSMLNTSFKIYSGIHVYGGFDKTNPESRPGLRKMVNGKNCEDNWADPSGIGTVSGDDIAAQWDFANVTVLTGNHATGTVTFDFDSIRGRFNTAFPASSYHVLWFATNGKYELAVSENAAGHYKPLDAPAWVDGCVISSGNASTRNTTLREHTAYGGGAYMVGNSQLRNCIVERCNATMRGGGIYMDGGGIVEFCKVMCCQSTGVGVVQGYGGGICVDYDGQVGHCHIMSNAARCGGGLAICHVTGEYPLSSNSNYSPFSTACVINNNTAAAEGGGIYLAEGGTINHATVTANNCISPDVVYYGRRHGRTGGIYVRDCGMIFNSVFWGNKCESNSDIQFASVRQTVKPEYEVFVYHSAFMNHDISDWTNVKKEVVFALEKTNMPIQGSSGNFPCFFSPTVDPLDWSRVSPSEGLYGAGVFMHMYPYYYPGPRIWHLTSHSALDQKGVQATESVSDVSTWLRHAHTDYGVVTNPFEPVSILGALVRKPDNMRHALIPQQGLEGRKDATSIPTIFVDLSHEGDFDGEGRFLVPDHSGDSWDAPLHSIGDALMYYRTYLVEEPTKAIGKRAHYHLPSAWDSEGNPTAYEDYDYVQMLVKEGEQSTAGPNNYLGKDMRTASIRTLSHMRLYGGYPKNLTETNTTGRDPLNHPTVITANITDEKGEIAYQNNSAHVLTYVNAEYAIVDGFQLLNGNAYNLGGTQAVMAGGGVLVNNEITDATKRIDMVGNELRNCRLANNSAPKGAAIYVCGDNRKRAGIFWGEVCYAELKVVNCIIRNNTADYSSGNHGIVTSNGRAFIDIDHCDIVNNVGYPLRADNHAWRNGEEMPFHGYIRVDNSLIYCNGTEVLNDRSALISDNVLSVDAAGQDYVFGTYNMFDVDIKLHTDDATQPHGFFKSDFTVPSVAGVLPSGMPDAANHPLKLAMPTEKNNQCIFTRTDRNAATYPVFVNPSRNIGHSAEGDRPLFGGKVSFVPLNNNPCVNAASFSAYGGNNIPRPDVEDYDLTDIRRRNFGGEPDVGALEDTDLPASGAVIYVTPNGAGKRDGSSWANAIAGNTVYQLNDIAGPALATGDQIDPEATCDRVLDSEGNPRLTTDSLYSGGWGKVWYTDKRTGATSTTTTTTAWITEVNTYVGGPQAGQTVVVQDGTTPTETTNTVINSSGSVIPGFTVGYDYDPRYPYGEISGASRSFWRANPYHNGSDWNNARDYADRAAFIAACNANGWINNTRAERYVGGLQYAVEKAAAANKSYHRDSVQVWVGAGTYNDYKGFVMRDSVTVLGGFPATKYQSPGITERQALMSNVINIPKSKPAEKLDATDYESILQISEVDPIIGHDSLLNKDAVKYWDDDYAYSEATDTHNYAYKTRKITNTYRYTSVMTDVTSYIYHPLFTGGSLSEIEPGHKVYGASPVPADKDKWHFRYPTAPTYYYLEVTEQNGSLRIFDYDTGEKIEDKSSRWCRTSNGSLTGLHMYQDMKNVEAGTYRLTLDMMGGYRAGSPFDITTPSNIYLHILDAAGNDLADSVLFKCRDYNSPTGTNASSVRLTAFRKTIEFTTTGTGDVTIMVEVLDGTKNVGNTYPKTPTGGDPDSIPWNYKWDKGTEANPNQPWGTNNPNRREFFITNLNLKKLDTSSSTYTLSDEDIEVVEQDTVVENPHASEVNASAVYEVKKHRITLRKRVLTMPDVCVPTYGAGSVDDPAGIGNGKLKDDLPHTDRVWGSTKNQRTAATLAKQEDPHYVEYNEVNWDGFTIRHGFITDEMMAHGGGAGVNMYEGAHLRNCIVINNMSHCSRVKGGGLFCDGATSTIEGCFVLNNQSTLSSKLTVNQGQIFAGGMFLYEGTCFNSLFANNYSYGSSGGVGFCVGRFFNNTIAYNTATLVENGNISGGAISLATSSNPNLFVANTIIFGNNGVAIRDRSAGYQKVNPFLYCYLQSAKAQSDETTTRNVINWSESATSNYGTGNTFHNGVAPSVANTPFAADFDEHGNYVAGRAASLNDFRLRDDVPCVNKGTEEFAGEFYTALRHKGKNDSEIRNSFIYQSVEAAQLPDNDVAFAKRVQDCQIDMGAYEFNAAYSIRPDTTTHPGQAIFYVTFDPRGGDASANSPENAACKQKLQQVLDAAGRYKHLLMTRTYGSIPATPISGQPDSTWTVEVWMEGDSTNSTTSEEYADWYTPTRSTKHNKENYVDNTLDYSFIIPHGIQVKGGYSSYFFHYENASGDTVLAGTSGAHIVDERDPLTYRTVLSGRITSSTGAEGNAFHVVTFTNDLFTPDETYYTEDHGGQEEPVTGQLAYLTDERHRAVLDGLFIEDGHANSPDMADRIGAGAVVTNYAHIRNCVVQNNTAESYGGGLYLLPNALVSGTIIKKNTADVGGGVYILAPESGNADSLAHVYSTTICENTATTSAGGMWFDNTNARVNSSVLWFNKANDFANVSGSFTRTSEDSDYPFNYCAVESRRLEGMGNVELSPRETEGVRWDREDPFNAILYYPIEMSSTLSRAGMTYNEWNKALKIYTTLDSMDIAGVCRIQWTVPGIERRYAWGSDTLVTKMNDFIEIGARALNKTFEINVDEQYVMRRLYVMHTDLIDSKAARDLQDNTNTDDVSNMYRQMGSCVLNPFHRLGDAFDYIIAARKQNPAKFRNTVFEVYIEQGTYYPYHNAYGEQGEVRNNTFLVPEGIYVIGGLDSRPEDHHYGQEGYYDLFSGQSYGDENDVVVPGTSYTIYSAKIDSIRLRDDRHRPMRDINLNSVIEPWELERQTILSGNAVAGEDFTHVYHVITMHADSTHVGPQPLKFRRKNDAHDTDPSAPLLCDPIPMDRPDMFHEEIDLSILGRTTEFDGIQITGGYANHLEVGDTVEHHYTTKTYFQGGGIFVDGNWTESYDDVNAKLPNITQPAKYNIPIVVENCIFTNNMAACGGALSSNGGIYMFGCHFTQNYSQGPMTKFDQRFIPWSAGGCISTNATCDISNTLFDNNEARRGLYAITDTLVDEHIPDADARQGFGGAVSAGQHSMLRVVNCNFTRNKAVAYSAIYNFLTNNHYHDPDSMQFAFNTIFWGNEVFDVDNIGELPHADGGGPSQESIDAFNNKYKKSRAGIFHYDGAIWERYEKLYHEYDSLYTKYTTQIHPDTFNSEVIAKLKELRQVGDSMEGLYFCAYRSGYGPSGMKPTRDGYLMTQAEQRAYKDSRQTPVRLKMKANGDMVEKYDSLFTCLHGNNNVIINRINNATDGPNFKQPSLVAGVDGYMQNADWLLARMNLTTDQGWGHMRQEVKRGTAYYITKYTGSKQFTNPTDALDSARAVEPSATAEDVYPVSGLPEAKYLTPEDPANPRAMSIYNFYAFRYGTYMSPTNPPLPLGDQYYMLYTRSTSDSESSGVMNRISKNPKMGETDVYIDMGIYEYQYVQLDIKGQEIDTMWVSTREKAGGHDGLTWETPTTDLQTAIDVLMSSHNNHDKYVCFISSEDETFSPTNVIDNQRAFIISSNSLAPLLPDSALADEDYAVKSLTFLGGYKYDVKERNPYEAPTIIEMPNIGSQAQLNQLFIVEDVTRQLVQVNWQGEYTTRDSMVIPITFDGLTFVNPYSMRDADGESQEMGGTMSKKGGAAIYYRWQRRYEDEGSVFTPNFNYTLYPDSVFINGHSRALPKLTVSNCVFMDNGARTTDLASRSAAVRIDHGGGSSLIVNSLFHSNAGAPIYAQHYDTVAGDNDLAKVPNDVVIVNSTFALNDGHITLKSDNSRIHNSLIWLDDLANDTLVQLELNDAQWDKGANKNRIGVANRVTDNAIWGCFKAGDETYNNDSLSTDNNDVFTGPCFSKPIVDAATSTQRRARSFNLNPGVQTMNRADTTLYRSLVFIPQYPDSIAESATSCWRRPVGFKAMPVYALANDSDLASKPRLSGIGMERGAYECLAVLQRVLYVQPNLPAATAGDGSSWLKPFGQGQLQNAIDAAAVYTYFNKDADRETRKAYVFVKGSYEAQDKYDIVARDGVNIYGSIPGNFNDTAWLDPEEKQFTNIGCQHYINYVRAITTGVASQDANPTRIASVSTEGGNDYATGFMIDGFVITNPGTALSKSPIIFDKSYSVMRNCIVTDIKTTGTTPVADIQNGLIYNSLFYADTASAIVRLGEHGLLLNNTILTAADTATPVLASDANAIVNTISGYKPNLHCFAPYLTQDNAYKLPPYLTQNAALAYQLHEHSNAINTGVEMANLPAAFDIYKADSTVHFGHDRDILGNPRRFVTVDKGAFETWRIEPGQVAEITARTNPVITIEEINTAKAENRLQDAFMEHYGGHLYPHRGSVVYLMDSSAITMQYEEEDFVDFNDNAIIFRPGYMLLKPGASFYGNGHDVQMNYLAAEKRFVNQQYSMTAFPFDYSVADVIATTYYPAADSLAQTLKPVPFGSYLYSGAARSVKDYVFHTDNSSAWLSIDTLNRAATQGYLMDFGAATDTLLRFTGYGATLGQYAYVEDSEDKYVYLTQHDNRIAGTGSGLNFTRQEDMGWNMKGLPWLVSNYRTDTILEGESYLRQMYIPHVFYQMDGAGEYLTDGDQMYSARSWDKGSTVAMGNAFFTQTATNKDSEQITFHLPYYARNEKASRPILRMTSSVPAMSPAPRRAGNAMAYGSSDYLVAMPDSTALKNVQYTYGRDAIKWSTNKRAAQLYMLDNKRQTRISLLGNAPTDVDIPLGVKVSAEDQYTFDLPEKEAFADYAYVWLIDYKHNRYTNLKEQDYSVSLEPGENNTRFALRIGKYPKTDSAGKRQYVIYAYQGKLFVRGIIPGDRITVYSPSGKLVHTAIASGYEYSTQLLDQISYVVQVNDVPCKVL